MKRACALLASVTLICGTAATVLAAPVDTVDPSVPTQLPRTAVPHHYTIIVTPHSQRLTFDGRVTIDLDVTRPTKDLVLNAANLQIASAALQASAGGASLTGKVAIDAAAQTATLSFPRTVSPGAYRLRLSYSGKINTQANGLFALDYTNAGGKRARSLFTQFEASDARRFVPSWDEPDYKATFDLIARVPANEMAVSNMPAASIRAIGGGLKEVRFQSSPTMSSYLLFFAAGDFDRITKPSGSREVGIVVSRGNGPKAQLALDSEAEILPYYNDYFGTPYPLPKLDNVAGPGQSQFFGAMENWGAIFTFERDLLNDPAITTEGERQGIFSVEAHEMAHQWFGDLVTMAWWDDIWLNEGFASWMANKATQHFHPDWGADVDHVAAREKAMALDAMRSTHPIVQKVRTVEQINQAFDSIAYSKGESVISMLEGFAGPDVWRQGIRNYIAAHAYQNTRTDDLWKAVEQAGARNLTQIAHDFTLQPGIPLIRVDPAQCAGGETIVSLHQGQFSADQREQVAAKSLSWHIPIRATAGAAPVSLVTAGSETELKVPGCGPLLINPGQTGYYRTLYRPEQIRALVAAFPALGPVDQYGVMEDSLALSLAGYQPMGDGLDFVAAVSPAASQKIVDQAVGEWVALYDTIQGNTTAQTEIAARVERTYGPLLQQLGFAPRAGEPATTALLREQLISTLGKFGDPAVTAESRRLFAEWQQNQDAIAGSLKETWLNLIARNADQGTWEILHEKAQQAKTSVERSTLYELLGATKDEALARRALDLTITDEPGATVSAGIITAVAAEHPSLAFDFVLAHVNQVNSLIDLSGRSRFVANLVYGSFDSSIIPRLEAYGNATFSQSDRKPIEQAIARIRLAAAERPRIQAETAQWLSAHPL